MRFVLDLVAPAAFNGNMDEWKALILSNSESLLFPAERVGLEK